RLVEEGVAELGLVQQQREMRRQRGAVVLHQREAVVVVVEKRRTAPQFLSSSYQGLDYGVPVGKGGESNRTGAIARRHGRRAALGGGNDDRNPRLPQRADDVEPSQEDDGKHRVLILLAHGYSRAPERLSHPAQPRKVTPRRRVLYRGKPCLRVPEPSSRCAMRRGSPSSSRNGKRSRPKPRSPIRSTSTGCCGLRSKRMARRISAASWCGTTARSAR